MAVALVLSASGCAVVGYPAPHPAPTLPRVGNAAEPTVRAAPVRSYEVFGRSYTTLPSARGYSETGTASWYGEPFNGRPTASGEIYDMYDLTAAHRTLPLATCVAVRRVDDGRSVVVRVNDRGPFVDDTHRIIDLSYAAARLLGLVAPGTAEVEVSAIDEAPGC